MYIGGYCTQVSAVLLLCCVHWWMLYPGVGCRIMLCTLVDTVRRCRLSYYYAVDIVRRCRLSYYAVFDGHGGSRASKYAAEHLHKIIADKLPVHGNLTSLHVYSGHTLQIRRPQGKERGVGIWIRHAHSLLAL